MLSGNSCRIHNRFRDVLAHRKPLVFQPGIVYGVWALSAGLAVHLGWPRQGWPIALLGAMIVALRLTSYYRGWSLPVRSGAGDDGAER